MPVLRFVYSFERHRTTQPCVCVCVCARPGKITSLPHGELGNVEEGQRCEHYSSRRKESSNADGGGDWVGYGSPGLLREARVSYERPAFTARVYAIAMHLFYFII